MKTLLIALITLGSISVYAEDIATVRCEMDFNIEVKGKIIKSNNFNIDEAMSEKTELGVALLNDIAGSRCSDANDPFIYIGQGEQRGVVVGMQVDGTSRQATLEIYGNPLRKDDRMIAVDLIHSEEFNPNKQLNLSIPANIEYAYKLRTNILGGYKKDKAKIKSINIVCKPQGALKVNNFILETIQSGMYYDGLFQDCDRYSNLRNEAVTERLDRNAN